jgi:hypothetical protein
LRIAMTNVTKFRYPDKKPTDPLLRRDPMPDFLELTPDARLIYLRIIDESEPGVLLQCDRMAVELAAAQTAQLLSKVGLVGVDDAELESLENIYNDLLAPDLGQEYISQILRVT